ncbi:class I SAM-dependent methyltransferase [Anoxybacteroides tepidamans]|uniref:class I SAM-dependent methyltransferase n=1 Tax=Anoxybacteroides tepidamans TaxID=265948 RepID=UPI000481C497|nr:hypothetical protein [Anoxybacillus tepidamans]
MFTFSDFQNAIDQQLLHNRNKSLFYESMQGEPILSPSPETAKLLKHRAGEIAMFIQEAKKNGTYERLLQYAADKTVKLFTDVNQYLNFRFEDCRELEHIYDDLFDRMSLLARKQDISDRDIRELFRSHYRNLRSFLFASNGTEIFKKYMDAPYLFEVKCAEYSPEFQIELLHIDLESIEQPILDLGCGSQAHLVHFLRENGYEAYGADRNVEEGGYLFNVNWLECVLEPDTWGTIISHMAFSNHFMHHHLRVDGDFTTYAQKYMEILTSLKVGGSFIYAPRLPFMEELLMASNESFFVEVWGQATHITKIQ